MEKNFVAGAAKAVITPPLGCTLTGYPHPTAEDGTVLYRRAEGVHDDLYVRAFALGDGNPSAVWLVADLCGVKETVCDPLRQAVAEAVGLPFEQILFSVTHTHSGPAITPSGAWGVPNTEYIENQLIPGAVKAAKEAIQNAVPAKMGVATTQSKVGINRRQLKEDGEIILGQNPHGSYDPTMTVLAFTDAAGAPLMNIVHYGCHGTAAGKNKEITRDWMGIMLDALERESGALSIYINGAEGDVGPRLSNGRTTGLGDIGYVHELGGVAAQDAVRAYRKIKEYRPVELRIATDALTLPYQPFPSLEELEQKLAEVEDPDALNAPARRGYDTWLARAEFLRSGKQPKTECVIPQTILALNDVALVPFRFEMFSEITLRLREYSPFTHTLGTCNTNGQRSYLPSRDQLCRGGYEVQMFQGCDFYTPAEETDDNIIRENLRILRNL